MSDDEVRHLTAMTKTIHERPFHKDFDHIVTPDIMSMSGVTVFIFSAKITMMAF